MKQRNVTKYRIFPLLLIITVLAPMVVAETLYVNGARGNDKNLGTKEKPLSTLGKLTDS